MSNIFISTCGNYIALRVPGIQPNFDIWKSDGSEMWEGERYVELIDKKDCYNPRRLFTESFAQPKKLVGSWSNFGYRIVKGENKDKWVEEFEVILHDMVTEKSITVRFNTPLKSLSPLFSMRRKKDAQASIASHHETPLRGARHPRTNGYFVLRHSEEDALINKENKRSKC